MKPDRRRAIDVILAAHRAPFVWGQSDCFTFAMDVVLAVTGTDPYAAERGRYKTARGALGRLARRDFVGLDDAFAALWPTIAPGAGLLGDVGVSKAGAGMPACVVHDGNGWVGRLEPAGITPVPIALVTRAYRIC